MLSVLTTGVIYFWKGCDTSISEINFAGTTCPTGSKFTIMCDAKPSALLQIIITPNLQ